MGCVASTIVGIICDFHPIIQIPLVLSAGVVAGAAYGGLVGFLKAKFGIHEVLTSIMFNWIALYFSNYICSLERFHKPDTIGSYPINKSGYTMVLGNWKATKEGKETLVQNDFLRDTLLKTDVNVGILAAIVLAILISFLLYRTTKGFELRAVGANRFAAESTGINVNKNILRSMIISGGICGLVAAFYITGNSPHGIATLAAFENTGFNALGICLIAASSPIGCIFAGLMFGGLLYGGQSLQYEVGAPSEIINIVIGITLMYSTPLAFAALGGVISERSGVTNLGIEGMMTVGAFTGAAVGYFSGNAWFGFLAAGVAGGMLALFHAFACISCRADQTISGIAMNLLGPGVALFSCRLLFDGATMSVLVTNKIPKLFNSTGVTGSLKNLNVDVTVVVVLILALLLWGFLYRTKWGLHICAVGEHPAADTMGINVYKPRYLCVIASGILAGLGAAQALTVILGGGAFQVPSEILAMLPYILTIVILILFVGRSAAPKASGQPYEKGAR